MGFLKEYQIKMEKKYYHIEDEKKEKNYHVKKLNFKKNMKINNKIKLNNIKKFKPFIIYYKLNKLNNPRIRVIINKKQIKLSTLRNKFKRKIYENFRINQLKIKKIDFIVKVNNNITKISKKLLNKYINKIWLI